MRCSLWLSRRGEASPSWKVRQATTTTTKTTTIYDEDIDKDDEDDDDDRHDNNNHNTGRAIPCADWWAIPAGRSAVQGRANVLLQC